MRGNLYVVETEFKARSQDIQILHTTLQAEKVVGRTWPLRGYVETGKQGTGRRGQAGQKVGRSKTTVVSGNPRVLLGFGRKLTPWAGAQAWY